MRAQIREGRVLKSYLGINSAKNGFYVNNKNEVLGLVRSQLLYRNANDRTESSMAENKLWIESGLVGYKLLVPECIFARKQGQD